MILDNHEMSTRMTLEGGNIQPNSRGDGDKIGIEFEKEKYEKF